MHRFSVQAVERHPRTRQSHRADQPINTVVLGVRYGNPAADAGRAEQFPLQDRLDNILDLASLEVTRRTQALHHLADDRFLAGGSQLGNNRFTHYTVRHAHAYPPSGQRRPSGVGQGSNSTYSGGMVRLATWPTLRWIPRV